MKSFEETSGEQLAKAGAVGTPQIDLGESAKGIAFINKAGLLQSFNSRFSQYFEHLNGAPARSGVSIYAGAFFLSEQELAAGLHNAFNGQATLAGQWAYDDLTISISIEPAFDRTSEAIGAFIHLEEDRSKKSSVDFKTVIEASGDAIIIFSPEGRPTYASPWVEKLMGYTPEEALQLDLYKVVHPEDLPYNQKVMEKAIFNPGIPVKGHVSRLLQKDGTWGWYDATLVNLISDPAVGGIVNSIRKLSESTQSGNAWNKKQWLNEIAAEASDVGVWELDLMNTQSVTNLKFEKLFGHQAVTSSWKLERLLSYVHPDDQSVFKEVFDDFSKDGSLECETRVVWHDQSVHWLSMKGHTFKNALGDTVRMVIVASEVTEKYALREALLQSESRMKHVLEHLSEGFILATKEGRILHWNQASLKMHGFTPSEAGPKTLPELLKFFKLYDQDGTILPLKKWPLIRLINAEQVNGLELKIRSRKEPWGKIFRYNGGSFMDASGEKVYFLTVSDVTALNSGKKTIRENEERFLAAFHLSPVALVLVGKKDGVCIDINKSAEKLLGYSHDESVGKTLLELNKISDADFRKLLEAIATGGGLYHEQIVSISTKSGNQMMISFSAEHVRLNNDEYRLVILSEVE